MNNGFSTAQKNAIGRIGGLILANAMIFQEILAEHDRRVLPLSRILPERLLLDAFASHWQFIINEINYQPIFHLAREAILSLTMNPYIVRAVENLGRAAEQVVQMKAALRHDLMGRVYHRLLAEAKYLGTYYTGVPAATLLLKLALRPDGWQTKWHDLEEVRKLRVADLACGTGTLLMAAAHSLTDNYVSHSAKEGARVDINSLHKVLAEDVFYGYDVVPSATHLTASTLALRVPHVGFRKMNLFNLPLGGTQRRLGSIEFLRGKSVHMEQDLFGAIPVAQRMEANANRNVLAAPLPDLDLCVMNPPFTRSVGGNLLFGSVPHNERVQMQKDLKKLMQRHNVPANVTAGLGSVFVAVADTCVKRGGRIALVLPKALLSGVAWETTRRLLSEKYRVEYIVASHDPNRWNFSENTNLSEILLVAQKLNNTGSEGNQNVVGINLWRNPSTSVESLAVARSVTINSAPDIRQGQGALELSMGEKKMGEAVAVPWEELKGRGSWLLPCAFAQCDLVRAALHLTEGSLWLPGHGKVKSLPMRPLGELGSLGPDARDIHDGFRLSRGPTPYAAFWGHDAGQVLTMAQSPNQHILPLPKAKKGRSLRKVEDLWPLAGRVLVAERLRLNTQRLAAIRVSRPVLSSTWWPFSFSRGLGGVRAERAAVLWLNSTLGLVLLILHRVETQGAWIKLKKPALAAMPVLDLSALSPARLSTLAAAYEELSETALQPFPDMAQDPVRISIDRSISHALGLPDFSVLREMLAREPVVCLQRL